MITPRPSGQASSDLRVVVTGATGNVGTSVLRALAADPAVDEVVALARSTPTMSGMPTGVPCSPMPMPMARGAAAASFALRLPPAEPGWVDMALGVPLMSTERARSGARRPRAAGLCGRRTYQDIIPGKIRY